MAKVACIGTGLVGRAWAARFAYAAHEVTIYDSVRETMGQDALTAIAETLDSLGAEAGTIDRVRVATTVEEAVADADVVQESVREDLHVKRGVAREIADYAPTTCLIASSTSALPGSGFLIDILAPERAFVAHPVNPPSLIRLVELCGTGRTSQASLDQARVFYEALGMTPVTLTKEIDGFLLNRLQYTLVAEAMHLVGEGYCGPEDIDRVLTEGLAPRWAFIGPFMTAHLNAANGFAGFVEQLGPMMRRMGEDAKTDYPWGSEDVRRIHESMAGLVALSDIPDAQRRRDKNILRLNAIKQQTFED